MNNNFIFCYYFLILAKQFCCDAGLCCLNIFAPVNDDVNSKKYKLIHLPLKE